MSKTNENPERIEIGATPAVASKELLCGARIELRCNGELILGTSVAKRPDNDAEYIALLEELLAVIKAPKHPAPAGF